MNAYQLGLYQTSNDYAKLAELARTCSILCIVDHDDCRDVARTFYSSKGEEEIFQLSARGISYIYAFSEEEFIKLCGRRNVGFIEPPQSVTPPNHNN